MFNFKTSAAKTIATTTTTTLKTKTPVAKIFLVLFSLLSKLFCQTLGVSFQTELLIMNFLGSINSIWDWEKYNWTHQVDEISRISASSQDNYVKAELIIKTALTWIVIARIITSHLYTFAYITNFYSILTWCRGKLLIPWLVISAVRNFLIEFIVILVIGLSCAEKRVPIFILIEFIIFKVCTFAPAVYNWLTMYTFYRELEKIYQRKMTRLTRLEFHRNIPGSSNIMLGMKMKKFKLPEFYEKSDENKLNSIKENYLDEKRCASLTNIIFTERESLLDSSIKIMDEYSRSLTAISTISTRQSHLQNVYYQFSDDVINNPILTPADKAKRILNITDQNSLMDNIESSTNNINSLTDEILFKKITKLDNSQLSDNSCPDKDESLKTKNDTNSLVHDKNYKEKQLVKEKYSNDSLKFNQKNLTQQFTNNKLNFSLKNNKKTVESKKIVRMNLSQKLHNKSQVIEGTVESKFSLRDQKKKQNIKNISRYLRNCSWAIDNTSIELNQLKSVSKESKEIYCPKRLNEISVASQDERIKVMIESEVQTDDMKLQNVAKHLESEDDEELKALRIYNAKTLLKDKLEIEKKFITSPRRKHRKKKFDNVNSDQEKIVSDELKNQETLTVTVNGSNKTMPEECSSKEVQINQIAITNLVEGNKDHKIDFQLVSDPKNYFSNLKAEIDNLDWYLNLEDCEEKSGINYPVSSECNFYVSADSGYFETIDFLQSAFSHDHRRIDFIDQLNSSGLYSISEQIPNVFHEIIKTARLRTLNHNCNCRETSEVDYGEDFLYGMTQFRPATCK